MTHPVAVFLAGARQDGRHAGSRGRDAVERSLSEARQRVRMARAALELRPDDPLGETRLEAALTLLERLEFEQGEAVAERPMRAA